MAKTIKAFVVAPDTPAELRKADRAVQSLTLSSRRQTVGLFDNQCVWVNGEPCAFPWQRLSVGDTIEVRYHPGEKYTPRKKPPKHLGFDVLFEDDHLIVVNKPAWCLTVPSPKRERNTLIQRISAYLTSANRGRKVMVHVVHRLDRGVSGVLVFAKTIESQRNLRRQFELHEPQREYLAIVAGVVSESCGTFRSWLATNESLKQYSTDDHETGQLAVTRFEVDRRLEGATLLRVRLETGRRNQIRVHFAEAGHPVLGDERYEPQRARHSRWEARRLALHARLLAFQHPVTGEDCQFLIPPPPEFQRFVESTRITDSRDHSA